MKSAVDALRACNAQFCLIGGFAVSLRAEPRLTGDVDFAAAVTSDEEAEKLVHALQGRGYQVVTILEQQVAKRLATVRFQHKDFQHPPFFLDLLFSSSGIEPEIVQRAELLEVIPGTIVPVARREHLIAMKCLSVDERTRPRDAEDLLSLLAVASETEIKEAFAAASLIVNRGYNRDRQPLDILHDFLARLQEKNSAKT